MHFLSAPSITALIVAVSFAAGLNTYATVATLGLLAHFGGITLPGGLETLAHPWVIAVSSLLFAVEFFADKIPAFDLLWNAAHTFIRVPVAALLAYKAASPLSPGMQLLAAGLGAALSGITHTSKTAARASVTASPEPFSNIGLSMTEDALAVGVTWAATHHPYAASGAVAVMLVAMVLSLRWIWRKLKQTGRRLFGKPQTAF